MNDSLQLARSVADRYSDREIKVVGHSLGGALALYTGDELDLKVIAINPLISPIVPLQLSKSKCTPTLVFRTATDYASAGLVRLQHSPPTLHVFNIGPMYVPLISYAYQASPDLFALIILRLWLCSLPCQGESLQHYILPLR